MNDISNFQNPMNQDPRRRLKKVKRPVKRILPQGGNMPAAPQQQVNRNNDFSNQYSNEQENFAAENYANDINLPAMANDLPEYSQNQTPRFINEEEMHYEQQGNAQGNYLDGFTTKKVAIAIGVATFVVGILFTKLFFSEQKVVRDGLQGVVINSEVPNGRARCGIAEKTQGCVLYIMNPQRQELNASDFYDLASQLTGRQRFIIETGNMRYSNRKIKPGEIAQFNIPPLQ